jgi:hypothetical protein
MYKYYNIMMYWWEIADRYNEFYSAFVKRDGATYQTSAHLSTNVLYV